MSISCGPDQVAAEVARFSICWAIDASHCQGSTTRRATSSWPPSSERATSWASGHRKSNAGARPSAQMKVGYVFRRKDASKRA